MDILGTGSPAYQFVDVGDDGYSSMIIEGVSRKLNLAPPKFKAMARLEDVMDVLPESQWQETNALATIGHVRPRWDQGQVGECEPTAEVEAISFLRAIAGLPPVKLSASFLYAHINNGVDQGASIGDGYPTLQQFGVCRDELCPTGHFYAKRQITQAMYADARNYKVLLAFHCPSFAEIVTARSHNYGIVHGVCVGQRFNKLDADGCYPATRGTPNHAVSLWDIRKRSNGEWFLWDSNHWTLQWGVNGDFGTSQSAYESLGYMDAIAYTVITIDSTTLLPPPASVIAVAPQWA